MRFDPKTRESRLVDRAANRLRNPSAAVPFSGGGGGRSVAPPGSTTVPIEDGDGQYLDGHTAFTDLDITDNIAALTGP